MKLDEYMQLAWRTAPALDKVTREHDLQHAQLGLCSEAGELADAMKKQHAYGKPLDRVNVMEELGDLMWFCALAARAINMNLSDIAKANIAKLEKRFPEKFTTHNALVRDLETEREILAENAGERE